MNVTVSTTHVHDGKSALAVSGLANGEVISVATPLCKSQSSINVAGFTLSAWVYLSGTALSQYSFLFFDAWGGSDRVSSPVLTGEKIVAMNTWYYLQATFGSAVDADHVAIRLNPEMSWSGIMYVDSVEITGP
jgi:hypothetical protein